MAQVSPARRVAYEVLRRVHGGGFSDALLLDMARPLAARDAGLAHEIVYGVLRHQNQLDWLAQHFSGRQILTVDEPTAILLRMGIYQMRYLTKIPPHAAVMEAVELAKRASKRAAAGLVNAVLRKVHKKELKFPDPAIELCLPEWLYRRWLQHYGKEQTRLIAKSFMQAPEKVNRAGYRMDSGAQTIVPLLDPKPGQSFLDLCAAPGNKTRQAVDLGVKAIACDRSFKRLLPLQQIGIPLVHLDAAAPLPFRRPFDCVLADAPCSGTGTLGRNPEIKWRLTPEDLLRQQARQIGILKHGLEAVAPGGTLVYSTCSLEKEENEDVVRAVCGESSETAIPMHYRIPGRDPGDGFFAAVIHKPA
ncbi:transcription antitermination factor NusB [Bryobacter aggregatus]|uniref:transcription antitermination factor NusB n=1 Tax=Bryobacter aggregatus TaxID=360054 RepID=UPI0004E26DD5|nr:transcription antitermination factor NusB [Bryobacter aggregatus]